MGIDACETCVPPLFPSGPHCVCPGGFVQDANNYCSASPFPAFFLFLFIANCFLGTVGATHLIRYDVFLSSSTQSGTPLDQEVFTNYSNAGQISGINEDWSTWNVLDGREDYVGVTFSGFLKVDSPGPYNICVAANDGAKLYVDGKLVLDAWATNEAAVPPDRCAVTLLSLRKGLHAFVLQYREATGRRVTVVFYFFSHVSLF